MCHTSLADSTALVTITTIPAPLAWLGLVLGTKGDVGKRLCWLWLASPIVDVPAMSRWQPNRHGLHSLYLPCIAGLSDSAVGCSYLEKILPTMHTMLSIPEYSLNKLSWYFPTVTKQNVSSSEKEIRQGVFISFCQGQVRGDRSIPLYFTTRQVYSAVLCSANIICQDHTTTF